ncbi:MAG: copper chaperone PCu(A)C [Caulobacteraceae bacterium]|nr:MAG: copper chaperone PCu(A)C [Caulobacteraceae bacterium]
MPTFAQEAHATHQAEVVVLGPIEITGAFTRATLPNAPVGGGFLTITNKGAEADRLVSVSTDIAKEAQIHEMAMEGDVMKMRQLKEGLEIPAGETVVLEPGGFHLMFMGLTGAIAEGDVVPVTLTFEKAGTVTVDLTAGATAADAPAHNHG